jgi:multidrug efflux system outer membrane protein
MMRKSMILAATTVLAGCNLAPTYVRPALPVPQTLPTGAAYPVLSATDVATPQWRDVIVDARLRTIIARALDNNRDLRAALATVESARAQYRVQRASQLPTVALDASATKAGGGQPHR